MPGIGASSGLIPKSMLFYRYVMLLSWAYGTTQELIYVQNTVAPEIAEIRKEFDR